MDKALVYETNDESSSLSGYNKYYLKQEDSNL